MKGLIILLLKNAHFFVLVNFAYQHGSEWMLTQEKVNTEEEIIKTLRKRIKKKKKENLDATEYRKNLKTSIIRVQEIVKEIGEVQRKLPNTISDPEILDLFSREAKEVNLQNLNLNPIKEDNRGFYFAKQYEMKGTGTYLQLLIFFENIKDHVRLINVKSLKMLKSKEKRKGRFQLVEMEAVMEAFRYNPAYNPDKEET